MRGTCGWSRSRSGNRRASLLFALTLLGWLAVLVIAAELVRTRRERAAQARAARQGDQQRQASEERLRMARDLHDVIGHNISLISIQAGVGLDLMEHQAEQARAALTAIKAASKEALESCGHAGCARQADETPPAPAPGLDRLAELVQLTRAAGLSVRTEVVGMPHAVAGAVDLAATGSSRSR